MAEKMSIKIGDKEISMEHGKLAKQADGAVVVQMGGTMVLVTCVVSKGRHRLLPAYRRISGKDICSRKDPGRLL